MSSTHTAVPMTDGRSVVCGEKVELRAFIDDTVRWRTRVACLLTAGRRRWLGRAEWDACPAVRRWNRIQVPNRPAGHPTLRDAVAAAAAGAGPCGTGPADFATAIMLLSQCPVVVTGSRCIAVDRPGIVTIGLFALPADDLALARDLAEAAIATTGVITARSTDTVVLAQPPRTSLVYPDTEQLQLRTGTIGTPVAAGAS